MGLFEGKTALVTGSGSGIGRATALAFAREGANVVIADLSQIGGEETLQIIKDSGGTAIFVETDVTRAADVESMVAKSVSTYGSLDCAFNNAGITGEAMANVVDYPEEMWDRVILTNMKGTFLCMKYELPPMVEKGNGTIVNMASVAGLVGTRTSPAYTASKHGVVGLTRAAALDYATAGVRINAVCPGVTHTPLIDTFLELVPEMEKVYIDMHPMGRLGEPDEIAGAVLWLCSDASSFVTGHMLSIDGGSVAQ